MREASTFEIRRGFWLALLFFFVFFFSHTHAGSVNDASNLSLAESLLERGTFYTDASFFFNRLDMAFYQGHFYSGKQPLEALYTAFVLFPAHMIFTFGAPGGRQVMYWLATVTSSGAALFLLWFFWGRALKLVGAEEKAAVWGTGFVFFGSLLLPFGMTYNNHVAEAPFLFGAFYFLLEYRKNSHPRAPLYCGLLLGVSTLIHLFAGSIFIFLTAVYFLLSKPKDLFRFLAAAGLLVVAGIGFNFLEHGNAKPFYMMPETYIYERSPRLSEPKLSNLSREKLEKRLDEIGAPSWQKDATLEAYENYKKSVSDVFAFARDNFLTRDFLALTPVFLIGMFSIAFFFFQKDFPWKREAAWVLAGTVLAYVGLLQTRSDAGSSFGNRYLIPETPLVLFFAVFYFQKKENLAFFKIVFWFLFAAMLPGVFEPWRMPPATFASWNLRIGLGLLLFHGICRFWGVLARGVVSAVENLEARPWLAATLVALFFRWEAYLYLGKVLF